MAGRRAVVGGVFEGLRAVGPGSEQVLRAPRLVNEMRSIGALNLDLDDLRQLEPAKVLEILDRVGQEPELRPVLALAIWVGTAQACLKGSYWSPSAGAAVAQVSCSHLVRPISCLHPAGKMPTSELLQAKYETQKIIAMAGCNPIDAALKLSELPENRHVAIIRCTPVGDPRSQRRQYSNLHEDQLFFRTTYYEAFERLAEDMHASPNESIKEGGIVYTSGVGVLRGPWQEGAPWVEKPPQVDVLWVGLRAHPQHGEQETYAAQEDRDHAAAAMDRAFAWAVAHGADAVVLSALGCDSSGCCHPRLQMAGLIHEAAKLHARHLPVVCIASDHPSHLEASWWDGFATGVIDGRPDPDPLVHVPPIPLVTDKLIKKDSNLLLEKRRKQLGAWSAPGARVARNSFI